jgi:hypothetical protein
MKLVAQLESCKLSLMGAYAPDLNEERRNE